MQFINPINSTINSGVSVVSVNLNLEDVNQCSRDPSNLFANTHKCHPDTTDCLPVTGRGFRRGSYVCKCKSGYYIPNKFVSPDPIDGNSPPSNISQHFEGSEIEEAFVNFLVGATPSSKKSLIPSESPVKQHRRYPHDFLCAKCAPGCKTCLDDRPCFVTPDMILRSLIVGFQAFCLTITFFLMIVVIRMRKDKVSPKSFSSIM